MILLYHRLHTLARQVQFMSISSAVWLCHLKWFPWQPIWSTVQTLSFLMVIFFISSWRFGLNFTLEKWCLTGRIQIWPQLLMLMHPLSHTYQHYNNIYDMNAIYWKTIHFTKKEIVLFCLLWSFYFLCSSSISSLHTNPPIMVGAICH